MINSHADLTAFYCLVVETFRRNVSTKLCGLGKKGLLNPDLILELEATSDRFD
ncbi:MAG TPA: hypothetical protein V6D12_19675 [Candidatus Obscuribacterales bacterium]